MEAYSGGDHQAGELFRQFAGAFKGKSQLHWSRGLRARLGLDAERSDEQLAAEVEEAEDVQVAHIRPDDWKLIRRHELRGLVLEMLRGSDWSVVVRMLERFRLGEPRPPGKCKEGRVSRETLRNQDDC